VVLTPVSLVFGQTPVNAPADAQNITVSNTGGTSVALGAATVTGDFAIAANTCGATLAINTGCTVSIVFKPTASGAHGGSFSITGDGTPLTGSLRGTGVLPATDALSPMALSFAPQALGSASSVRQVTLTNAGDVALTLITAVATGDFAATNGCGNSLSAHASCAISVAFQPKSLGAATGGLTVGDQYRSQTVALSGTGIAPPGVSLSPLFSINYPATGVGLASVPAAVTLTNNGGLPLAMSAISISGDFTIVAGSSTCGSSLAVGAACTMQVAFLPTVSGARNGTLSVVTNAPNSPHKLALGGAGVDFALAANGPSGVTVASGQSAVFPLLYTAGAAVAGANVALTCSGAPISATCKIAPSTLAVDGNATTVAVTVLTGTTGSASLRGEGNVVLALLALPAGLMVWRRRNVVGVLCLCVLVAGVGCGGGRLIPSSGSEAGGGGGVATPAGSYNITVTASGYGLTRSVGLTLKVQ